MIVTRLQTLFAVRIALACGKGDALLLNSVFHDMAEADRPDAPPITPGVMMAMGSSLSALASERDPGGFLADLERAAAELTRQVELYGPDSPAETA